MKIPSLLILFTLLASGSFAQLKYAEVFPVIKLVGSDIDENLKKKQAIYRFEFKNVSDTLNTTEVLCSMDNVNFNKKLIDGSYIEFKTTPGEHKFQFYYNQLYHEVYTQSLSVSSQQINRYEVRLTLITDRMIRKVAKPVIYLYPEEETEVDVHVNINGIDPFFYPEYNNGWKCTAQPDGTLTINDASYNYLFWEATGADHLMSLNLHKGFVVDAENVIPFLEKKLSLAGLTPKEQTDFITYWGPIMTKHDHNYVRFIFNEDCDKFAKLEITPKPDNLYRIYILTAPVSADYSATGQEITPINRSGFTAIEWGGQETTIEINDTSKH